MGCFKPKLRISFLLVQVFILSTNTFPSHNLEGFHDLDITDDPTFDLNEEESKFHSTAIPPPEHLFLHQVPQESLRDETTVLKPENQTESYETTTEPLVIIQTRYQIEVSDKKTHSKRNNDDRGEKLTTGHPEEEDQREEEDSTPAYGVLENASVRYLDEEGKNSTGGLENCKHDVMETEKPILKHAELEDGVLLEVKRDPLPDFEDSILKELDDEIRSTLSHSHETNTVQLKDTLPTEPYTAEETQIVLEDKQKPEAAVEKDEMKAAGTDLAIVIQTPSAETELLKETNATTIPATGETTVADTTAEPNPEDPEAKDIGSADLPGTQKEETSPVEFEDEPVDASSPETGTQDVIRDAEVDSLVKHGATYYFRSAVEDVCLTAHKHKFMDIGIHPGAVTAEEFERADNQLWDLLKTQDNEFWLVNHRYGLSEATVVKTSSPFPAKNFITILPTQDRQFLMKSTLKDECMQFQGKHEKIIYTPCNQTLISQHWIAEFLYEEEKLH